MTLQLNTFSNDLHLYPLYLKLASDNFRKGEVTEGKSLFEAACSTPSLYAHTIYKKLWKIKGRPEGDYTAPVFCIRQQEKAIFHIQVLAL